jgi:hypothetical protein
MRWFLALVIAGFSAAPAYAQDPPATAQSPAFDAKFFQVLKALFDDFSGTDLARRFQSAQPIQCSELLGDWRPAAFLNDDPKLERWFYRTFGEVQAELARYSFRGRCDSESAPLDVSSRFPIRESVDAYNSRKIDFDKIAYKVNAAVRATFDARTRTYGFSLPYLYLAGQRNGTNQYSLVPPDGTAKPTSDVTNAWDCKAVKPATAAYRLLLCRTVIQPRNTAIRSQAEAVAGTSAFVILSDGKEAVSTFTLSSADSPAPAGTSKPVSKVFELGSRRFRLQFARKSWEDRIDSVMTLVGGKLEFPEAAATSNRDYCEWIPQSPATAQVVADPDRSVEYKIAITDRSGPAPTSISFEARTATNFRLGTLRCFFPAAALATDVDMANLSAIAGDHLSVELR